MKSTENGVLYDSGGGSVSGGFLSYFVHSLSKGRYDLCMCIRSRRELKNVQLMWSLKTGLCVHRTFVDMKAVLPVVPLCLSI